MVHKSAHIVSKHLSESSQSEPSHETPTQNNIVVPKVPCDPTQSVLPRGDTVRISITKDYFSLLLNIL